MTPGLVWRIARRELRGGLSGFAVFLACLALGVAAIAAVGTVREAIRTALTEQGAVLLGGDAQLEYTYRFATDAEREWMEGTAVAVSEIVDFRSMAVVGDGAAADRALTQVKAVDDAYPLTGAVALDPPMSMAQALAGENGRPGGVMDGVLVDRLGLAPGDTFRLGLAEFVLTARLDYEPDSAAGGFGLGPRTIVRTADLEGSQLLGTGTLFETEYRMLLPDGADLASTRAAAEAAFPEAGMRWQDKRRAAPGAERFVDRMGSFLVLVGLAGLAVGGVGVSAAVRSYLDGKVETIAILKVLGAEGGAIRAVYLVQVGILAGLGVGMGLILGAGAPLALAPLIEAQMPIPVAIEPRLAPLAEAAFYGLVTAGLFTLWPLSRVGEVRAAALFRDLGPGRRALPSAGIGLVLLALVAALLGAAVLFTGLPTLALGTFGGVAGALVALTLAASGLRRLSRRAGGFARGRPALRAALAAIGGPREEATAVILSLGLGLSVLAAVGQIDWNLRSAIDRDLPEIAPSYFFVDIQPDQIDGFLARLGDDPDVSRVQSAPMLRGVITRINGRPARDVAGNHWVVRGDRGVTYAATPPPDTTVTAGTWWPADYDGPPQVSFAAEEAEEMGLQLGDRITVNILGRDVEAEITSFRAVDFSTAGIGFVMAMNPAAIRGAPHTHIATVYAAPRAEAAILRDLAGAYPNITAIRIKDAIDRVTEALGAIARATAIAAGATLVTGFVVLIGAAAAGERARLREAAILKTLGATRGQVLRSFALRSALMGAAAGGVAILVGGLSAWSVMTFVMEATFRFEPVSALAIVIGGAAATLLAGLVFALRPLGARPAQVLRTRD